MAMIGAWFTERKLLWLCIAAVGVGAFFNGHLMTKWYYQRELAELRAQAARSELKAAEQQRETENVRHEQIQKAERENLAAQSAIDNAYRLVLTDNDNYWMQYNAAASSAALPASPAVAAEAGQCIPDRRLAARCRRTEKLLIDMARERDAIAAQYNELLHIYKGVETSEKK